MKSSYTVVVERDPESGWLVGEVVELPGCYTQAPDLPSLESNYKGSDFGISKHGIAGGLTPDKLGHFRLRTDRA